VGSSLFPRRAGVDFNVSDFAATVSIPYPEPAFAPAPDSAMADAEIAEAGIADSATADSAVPDVITDFGSDSGIDGVVDSGSAEVAAKPTLSSIGRYALKQQLGQGGLGTVFEAWDPLLSRMVAVKTLQFDIDTPARVSLDAMFLNEARAAAGLSHAHIVTVHDAGLSAHGVYIAMERLRGRDMREALRSGWRPAPAAAATLVRRVADALAYAHARGVVHCDIKPANIFLARHDRPKVLDFGIARVAHRAALPELESVVAGSPHYLSPEQLQGGTVDARSDLYSLGVVMYELLTGRKAFDGDSLEQIHTAVLNNHPAPIHELCPEVPTGLSAVAQRAMARQPDERFASAAEMAQALRHWNHEHAAQLARDARRPKPARRPARSGARVALATVATVALLGLWWQSASAPSSPLRPTLAGPVSDAPMQPVTPAGAPVPAPQATPAALLNETVATSPQPPGINLAPSAPAQPVDASAASVPTAQPTSPASPAAKVANTTVAAVKPRKNASKPTASAPAAAAAPVAPAAKGTVQMAISPWGQVEVDGAPVGTTPPLTRLELTQGSHTITVRNEDFPPFTRKVQVEPDQPVLLKHRFGS
jgi:serine/threonine protein kinase